MQTNIDDITDIKDMNKFRKVTQGSEQITLGTLTKENGKQTKPGKDTIKYLSQIHLNKAMTLKPTPTKHDRIFVTCLNNWDDDIIT